MGWDLTNSNPVKTRRLPDSTRGSTHIPGSTYEEIPLGQNLVKKKNVARRFLPLIMILLYLFESTHYKFTILYIFTNVQKYVLPSGVLMFTLSAASL